eukprot:TRINITY_DN4543_c0_g5_i1.p1 TRINITY_DN4543_c0_g5~~TRINITY_DN4543_c0_g5_i1.p1  ORF type:complete len:1108 (+),score=160.06 TRINITY_DN4543_c0_g5_i1:80-3403(+)
MGAFALALTLFVSSMSATFVELGSLQGINAAGTVAISGDSVFVFQPAGAVTGEILRLNVSNLYSPLVEESKQIDSYWARVEKASSKTFTFWHAGGSLKSHEGFTTLQEISVSLGASGFCSHSQLIDNSLLFFSQKKLMHFDVTTPSSMSEITAFDVDCSPFYYSSDTGDLVYFSTPYLKWKTASMTTMLTTTLRINDIAVVNSSVAYVATTDGLIIIYRDASWGTLTEGPTVVGDSIVSLYFRGQVMVVATSLNEIHFLNTTWSNGNVKTTYTVPGAFTPVIGFAVFDRVLFISSSGSSGSFLIVDLPDVTDSPTAVPTLIPTAVPTAIPTAVPTLIPTAVPTEIPTAVPTEIPTAVPTEVPTAVPTLVPTAIPTLIPTGIPTGIPTAVPTEIPTAVPTLVPTAIPTGIPTAVPTLVPTAVPTLVPMTGIPTAVPTLVPTNIPTTVPTTIVPTHIPTAVPTMVPTIVPTAVPTAVPTIPPTGNPTIVPSKVPATAVPTSVPTLIPTAVPTVANLTAKKSIITEEAQEAKQQTETVASTTGAVVAIATLLGASGGSSAPGQALIVDDLDCTDDFDDEEELPLISHPLMFRINGYTQAGAVVGNLMLCIGCQLFFYALVNLLVYLDYGTKSDDPSLTPWIKACAIIRYPSVTFPPPLFLMPGTLESSLDILFSPRGGAVVIGIAIVGLLACIGFTVFLFFISYVPEASLEPVKPASTWKGYLFGFGSWESSRNLYVERHGVTFDVYNNLPWLRGKYFAVEGLMVFPVAIIVSIRSGVWAVCITKAVLLSVVLLAMLFVTVYHKIFIAPFLKHLMVFTHGMMIIGLFCHVIAFSLHDLLHPTIEIGMYFFFGAMIGSVIRALYDLLTFFSDMYSGFRRVDRPRRATMSDSKLPLTRTGTPPTEMHGLQSDDGRDASGCNIFDVMEVERLVDHPPEPSFKSKDSDGVNIEDFNEVILSSPATVPSPAPVRVGRLTPGEYQKVSKNAHRSPTPNGDLSPPKPRRRRASHIILKTSSDSLGDTLGRSVREKSSDPVREPQTLLPGNDMPRSRTPIRTKSPLPAKSRRTPDDPQPNLSPSLNGSGPFPEKSRRKSFIEAPPKLTVKKSKRGLPK